MSNTPEGSQMADCSTGITVTHDGPRIIVTVDVDDDFAARDATSTIVNQAASLLAAELDARADAYAGDEVRAILSRYGLTIADLRAGGRRRKDVIQARQQVSWTLRQAGWSYHKVGRYLHRDHSTIMHAVRQWEARQVEVVRDHCEVCGDPSLGGGRWCLRHFQQQADRSRDQASRNRTEAAKARYRRSA